MRAGLLIFGRDHRALGANPTSHFFDSSFIGNKKLRQGCEPPPGKVNVKSGTPLFSLYFGIYYSFGSQYLVFFVF